MARYLNSSSEFSYLNINYLAKQKLRITNTSRMKDEILNNTIFKLKLDMIKPLVDQYPANACFN